MDQGYWRDGEGEGEKSGLPKLTLTSILGIRDGVVVGVHLGQVPNNPGGVPNNPMSHELTKCMNGANMAGGAIRMLTLFFYYGIHYLIFGAYQNLRYLSSLLYFARVPKVVG